MRASILSTTLVGLSFVSAHSYNSLERLLNGKVDYCRNYLGLDRYTTSWRVDFKFKTVTVKSTIKKTLTKTERRTTRSGTKWVTKRPVVETGYLTITPTDETQVVTIPNIITLPVDPVIHTVTATITGRPPVFKRDEILPRHALDLKGYQKRHISSVCSSIVKKAKSTKVRTFTKTFTRKSISTKTVTRGVAYKTVKKTTTLYVTIPQKTRSTSSTTTKTKTKTLEPNTITTTYEPAVTLPGEPDTHTVTATVYVPEPPKPCYHPNVAEGSLLLSDLDIAATEGDALTDVNLGLLNSADLCKPKCLETNPTYVAWFWQNNWGPGSGSTGWCHCLVPIDSNLSQCAATGVIKEFPYARFRCFGFADSCQGTYTVDYNPEANNVP